MLNAKKKKLHYKFRFDIVNFNHAKEKRNAKTPLTRKQHSLVTINPRNPGTMEKTEKKINKMKKTKKKKGGG